MEKLKIAVIGCGRIAEQHLTGYARIPDIVEVAAVVDIVKERADAYRERFGVRKAYYSVEEVLHDEEIEAVSICLAHYLHYPISVQCMKAGKHVLVEKVMSRSYEDSLDMVREAKANNVTLMVGQSRRFYEGSQKALEMIGKGEIGDLVKYTLTWFQGVKCPATEWWKDKTQSGGLVMMLMCSHALDYVTCVKNFELPKSVYCRLASQNPNWDGDDEVSMLLEYKDGSTAALNVSFNAHDYSEYRRVIIGTKGTMLIEGEGDAIIVNGEKVFEDEWDYPAGFAAEVTEFAHAIRESREPKASGREVAQLNAIIDAAFLSDRTNAVVYLEELYPSLSK